MLCFGFGGEGEEAVGCCVGWETEGVFVVVVLHNKVKFAVLVLGLIMDKCIIHCIGKNNDMMQISSD